MIDLKFPDGAVRQYPAGSTARDVATSISPSLAKKAVLAELNGEQRDMGRVLEMGGDFRLIMRDDPAALYTIRHDTAHVLAEAVQTLFPGQSGKLFTGDRIFGLNFQEAPAGKIDGQTEPVSGQRVDTGKHN